MARTTSRIASKNPIARKCRTLSKRKISEQAWTPMYQSEVERERIDSSVVVRVHQAHEEGRTQKRGHVLVARTTPPKVGFYLLSSTPPNGTVGPFTAELMETMIYFMSGMDRGRCVGLLV